MSRELYRLLAEAKRLDTLYQEHKGSSNEYLRKKVHLDLDRFLMENRETAIVAIVQCLQDATAKQPKKTLFQKLREVTNGNV